MEGGRNQTEVSTYRTGEVSAEQSSLSRGGIREGGRQLLWGWSPVSLTEEVSTRAASEAVRAWLGKKFYGERSWLGKKIYGNILYSC